MQLMFLLKSSELSEKRTSYSYIAVAIYCSRLNHVGIAMFEMKLYKSPFKWLTTFPAEVQLTSLHLKCQRLPSLVVRYY